MNRTTAFSLASLAAAAGLLPHAARAADDDTQVWLTGTAVMPLDEDLSGSFEVSRRFRDGDDQLLLRGNADYRINDTISLGGGAAVVNSIDGLLETGNDGELRLQQQVNLSFGALSLRTRLEERFLEDSDRMQLRIRQRIQGSWPVAERLKAAISAEMFYIARSDDEDGEAQVSQWRLSAALAHPLNDKFDLTVGYLMIFSPRVLAPDSISHVPQLTVTYRR